METTLQSKLKQRLIIIVYSVSWIGLAISIALTWADINTTIHGYEILPTVKTPVFMYETIGDGGQTVMKSALPIVVGLMPTVVTIFGLYLVFDKNQGSSTGVWLFISLASLFFDFSTDFYYKMSIELAPWYIQAVSAFIETLVIYTVFSEVLLAYTFAFITNKTGEFIAEMGLIWATTVQGFRIAGEYVKAIGEGDDDDVVINSSQRPSKQYR